MDKKLKRRDFLKLLSIAPFAPSVLKAKEDPVYDIGVDIALGKSQTVILYSIPRRCGKSYFYQKWKKSQKNQVYSQYLLNQPWMSVQELKKVYPDENQF